MKLNTIKEMMRAGDLREAEAALREYLKADAGSTRAKVLLGVCLHLQGDEIIEPENSHLFAAIGSCLNCPEDAEAISISTLIETPSWHPDGCRDQAHGPALPR